MPMPGQVLGASWSPYYGGGGYFDYSNFYPHLVVDTADPSTVHRLFDSSQLVDQTQMFDPLFNPSQMVDLSRGIDLSRTRGTDPYVGGAAAPGALLPGPGVVGLYGLFEGDFVRGDPDPLPPPRPRGLLLLGAKKKAWRPRVLGAVASPGPTQQGVAASPGPTQHGAVASSHHRRGGRAHYWPQPVYYTDPQSQPYDVAQMLATIQMQQMLLQMMAAQYGLASSQADGGASRRPRTV